MGFDNDCILNIQSLAGEYFCPVCHLLVYPNEALQAPCTHLYCKPCLTYVVGTTHACPYDGYRVTESDCKPLLESNKTLADTIGKIQVHCLYYRTGCTWQGALSDCTSHCSTCSFGESPVLCNRCSVQIVHRQVQEHAQNCPGVQSQPQQTGAIQDSTSTGVGTTTEQSKTTIQTGIPAPQTLTSQAPAPIVSGQDANSAASSAQPQATQAAMPTPEQWQQYQQQYQQYYQQYPGYDPYQNNYQYYYQYQQGAQQYAQQPPMQGYPPQPYGQTQPQVYGQAPVQVQPQLQAQQVQPQVPPQTPQAAQPIASAPLQAQAQGQVQQQMPAQVQGQPQMPPQIQGQPQMQGQGQAPSSQALPYNQTQSYVQPQPITQQTQVPKYQQTPQMQYPPSQPYPQPQTTQTYPHPHPQSQVQTQPNPQPAFQAPTYPPSQQNPLSNPGPHLPTQNAVSGYQSYPQPQPHPQGQGTAAQPQYPAQMQGQFPSQPSQMYPQPYSNVPNQQVPPASSAQGQPPSGPGPNQPPVFPHSQQPGYPIQPRPGQQPPFSGHGPYMQPQQQQQPPQPVAPQSYAPGYGGQQNMGQSYGPRPVAQGAVSQLYAPAPPHAGPGHGQVRPSQLNQSYPTRVNNQMPGGEKPHDQVVDKSMGEVKIKSENVLDSGFDGKDGKVPGSGSRPLESDTSLGISESSPGSKSAINGTEDHKDARKKAESQDPKQTVKSGAPHMPQSNLIPQVHGANTFPPSMQFGPSGQPRPGGVPMSQSTLHLFNSPQSTIGHPPRPGQAPPRPPFSSGPGLVPHESGPGSGLMPGSSGSFPRPVSTGYHQGMTPPYQGGPPQNPPSESFGGSSFDSHMGARERTEFEQRPRYPADNEKFPAQRPGYFDGRKPEPLPHGSLDRAPYGPVQPGAQPGAMKIGGPPAHDSITAPGMRDERGKPFSHREFEDDPRKFPRPAHFEAGLPSKLGSQFPSSGPLDHRTFDKAPHGFDRDQGLKMDPASDSGPSRFLPPFHPNEVGERGRPSGFSEDNMGRGDFRHRADFPGPGLARSRMDGLPPRSPGRDFPGLPPRNIGSFGDGGNNFPSELFGKSIHDSRFPVPPNHLQRGEIDVPGNLRVGGPHNQDMLPNHLKRDPMGPRNMHMGEVTHPRMGEPPLGGNFPHHPPFGGEKPGHPRAGEPGFRGSSNFPPFGREGGFYPEEMDPFDDPRKWKPVGVMCRICKVECGTVEGLDLHSQSREHQRNARDMVLSIKQQNKKKQKISKDQGSFEGRGGGRPRNPNFQGRGNKF